MMRLTDVLERMGELTDGHNAALCTAHPDDRTCGRFIPFWNLDAADADTGAGAVPDPIQPGGFFARCCGRWCSEQCGAPSVRKCYGCMLAET